MSSWRHFPWHTLIMLLLTTWAVGLVASLWVQALVNTLAARMPLSSMPGWLFTFATYFRWEPWVDGVILAFGIGYVGWRWLALLRALWERWG